MAYGTQNDGVSPGQFPLLIVVAIHIGYLAFLQNMLLSCVKRFDSQGRQIVLVSNDITHKAGSFGTREDVVFKLASEFAREKMIPRIYIAANSGARIGVSDSVKRCFQVAFKNPKRPESGFDYLFVNKEDFKMLRKFIRAEATSLRCDSGVTEVYKINDIIGSELDLGVENLKGSGLIAGETSSAYNDVFTMTIVLGR